MKDTKDIAITALAVVGVLLLAAMAFNYFQSPQQKANSEAWSPQGGGSMAGYSLQGASLKAGVSSSVPPYYGWGNNDRRLLSVSGSVTKSAAPDRAVVTLSVETLDKSASVSQGENARISDSVRKALAAAGVADSDIKTVSYTLNEEFEWNDMAKKSESKGYRASNSIEVNVQDLSNVGKVIDAAVKGGANRVSSIEFSLSREKENELRTAALLEASANAKARAQSIAKGFGVAVGNLWYANEGYSYVPVYTNFAKGASPMAADGYDTPITAGDVKVTVSVDAQFEIQ